MKDKNITSAFVSFAPSEEQKERIYGKIASGQPGADRKNRGKIAFVCAAACVVLAVAAAMLVGGPGRSDNTAVAESGGAQTGEPEISSVLPSADNAAFSGFVLTAYRPSGGAEYLGANFGEEAERMTLRPDVEVLLARYSPLMSNVPGLPFTVDIPDGLDVDSIRVSADGGALCEWDQATGIVTQRGSSAEIIAGGTIYWLPVGNEVGTDIASATITVEAVTDGVVVGTQRIRIVRDEQYCYSATAGEPETI